MPKKTRPPADSPPEPSKRTRRSPKKEQYEVEEQALEQVKKKPMTRAKTPKPAVKTRKTSTRTRARARPGDEGWKRWLALEALTVGGGLLVGFGIAGGLLWVRAKKDVAEYLANPPRPVPSVVWSGPMEIHKGMRASIPAIAGDLLAAGFERVDRVAVPQNDKAIGVFTDSAEAIDLWSSPWTGPTGKSAGGLASIKVVDGLVVETSDKKGLTLRPTVLGTLGDLETKRDHVDLDEVSKWVEPALLSMEDTRFRTHHGVDPVGVLRALWSNASGQDVQGGSTLTQQLAKNLFLTKDRTLRRKVREAFFAAALESDLEKDELLELYLSEIYLGQMGGLPLYGVDAASRAWFGVSAKHLELHQAALIVGVIPAPNAWSPVRNPTDALDRRNVVLARMKQVEAIDEDQYQAAITKPIALEGLEPSRVRRAPYAVDAAVDRAEEILGEGALASRAYGVYTAINPVLQRAAEDAVAQGMAELDAEYPKAAGAQVALVAVRLSDGAVVAMIGGRSYADSPFNRARDAERQAGSTVKPLTMLAAFEEGKANPATRLQDQPMSRTVSGVTWTPQNYDKTFLGEVSLRQAIEGSRNIPAIHLAESVGATRLQDFLQDAGLSGATHLPSAALGSFEVTPMELAGAYTAFDKGFAYVPRVVMAITDPAGKAVQDLQSEGHLVASEQAAALAVHVLQGVIESGTGAKVTKYGVKPQVTAGKTGTTDDYRDAWFVGLTPEIAVAVWVGQDEGSLGLSGSRAALPTWARFVAASGTMRGALRHPDGIVELQLCSESDMPVRDACPSSFGEWFIDGEVPEEKCDVHGGPIVRTGRLFGRLFKKKDRPADEDEPNPKPRD